MTVAESFLERTDAAPAQFVDGKNHPVGFSELFKMGIGPSSSHTIGPMKAARSFVCDLGIDMSRVCRLSATVFGSLAWTGTPRRVLAINVPEC